MKFKPLIFLSACIAVACPSLLQAQTNPPAWNAATTYQVGDLAQYNQNFYRAIHVTTGATPTKGYANWELYYARYTLTLDIGTGQTFPNLTTAWKYVASATIAQGANIHLDILTTHGNYLETLNAPFSLDHPFGFAIDITGDSASKITFEFPSTSGFYIDTSHTLAGLNNVTIDYNSTVNITTFAVHASSNASLSLSNANITGGWAIYAYADGGGKLSFAGTVNWTTGIDRYVEADNSAQISLPANSNLSGDLVNGANIDLTATNCSRITVGTGSTISGGQNGGSYITDMSQLIVDGCTFSGNLGQDIDVENGSTAHAQGANVPNGHAGTGSYIFT